MSKKMVTEIQEKQLPHLPEKIIQNILKGLPVKSLVRFSCTCKGWRSLIFSDSKFNNAHLHHAKKPSWKLIPKFRSETTIDCDCNIGTTSHPTLTKSFLHDSILLGTCNGILFTEGNDTSDPSKQLILWNPYINSIKWIHGGATFPDYYIMYGLTYDRVSDDYKAIVVFVLNNDRVFSPCVFSLRKNSWKKLSSDLSTVNICETLRHEGRLGITLDNGICYWKVELEPRRSGVICFDPVVEEFKDVPLPDMLRRSTGRLGALDGCLSFIHFYSVWVMKEYGRWTKLYDLGLNYVGHLIRTFKPVGYNSTKDEVVVLECGVNFGYFWIADVKKGVVRRPSDDRFSSIDESRSRNINIYSESLMCPWLEL